MTRVALKTKYESEPEAGSGTLTVGAGELKLKASCSDWTFLNGVSSLRGISLGIEKPGAFLIDYDLHQQVWHCLLHPLACSIRLLSFCFHIAFPLYRESVCVCVCVPLEICATSIVVLLISCLILNGSIVDGHHWIDIYLERGTASPACQSNFEISFCQFLEEFIGAVE